MPTIIRVPTLIQNLRVLPNKREVKEKFPTINKRAARLLGTSE